MTTIRQMNLADLGGVVTLEKSYQPRPWSEQIFRDELTAENRVYLVAEDVGVVGFGGVMVIGDEAHIT
ncbi:MAG: ribosomal protein S18-alanine N-acetyltransferase, partial [Acidimicrobiia bacterium]